MALHSGMQEEGQEGHVRVIGYHSRLDFALCDPTLLPAEFVSLTSSGLLIG